MRKPSFLIVSILNLCVAYLLFVTGTAGTPVGAAITAVFLASGLTLGLASFGDSEWRARFPIKAALVGPGLAAQCPWLALSIYGRLGDGAGAVELLVGALFGAICFAVWRRSSPQLAVAQ